MRIVHGNPLPRSFKRHPHARKMTGIVAEGDLRVLPRGRLFVKLVVFDKPLTLALFWQNVLGNKEGLAYDCLGCVNAMADEIHTIAPRGSGRADTAHLLVDPRYVCIMGLTVGNLGMEIITHESVHAGFAYAKRRIGHFWTKATEMDEEKVCYPAGIIAKRVNAFLHAKGLYE